MVLLPCAAFGYGDRVDTQDAEATARGDAVNCDCRRIPPPSTLTPPASPRWTDSNIEGRTLWDPRSMKQYKAPARTGREPMIPRPTNRFSLSRRFSRRITPPHEPFAFGLGVYAPFGLKTEWARRLLLPDLRSLREPRLHRFQPDFLRANHPFALRGRRHIHRLHRRRTQGRIDLRARRLLQLQGETALPSAAISASSGSRRRGNRSASVTIPRSAETSAATPRRG